MYELFSSLLKYIFITIIYIFIFGIIRLIYMDIKSMNSPKRVHENVPYLKLINRKDRLDFKVLESYILNGNKIIGRSSKCDIAIFDPFLSSEHAQLIKEDGLFYVEDLDSTNGTFVNGDRIDKAPVPLNNGDKISLGQVDFLFVGDTQ